MSYQMTNLNTMQFITEDVVFAFQKAIANKDNLSSGFDTKDFWNGVSSDMYIDLSETHGAQYIKESFDFLVECEIEDRRVDAYW